MGRLWPILVLLLISSAGAYAQKKMPEWVISTPVDQNAYYGVGIASINDNLDYRDKARKKALKEIAEKIFVNIRSESSLYFSYRDQSTQYTLEEDINTKSTNFLEGYEKVSDWIDKKNDLYYVLFRLDKSIHERNRQRFIDHQLSLLADFKDRALELFLKDDYTTAFAYLESGIDLAGKILSDYLEPHYELTFQKEFNEFRSLYEDKLSRLEITLESEEVFFNPLSNEPTRLYFSVSDRFTEKNIPDFPLKLRVFSGDLFAYEIDSDEDHYFIKFMGVLPEDGLAKFRIIPDLKGAYLQQEEVIGKLISEMESKTITVKFIPINVKISVENKNGLAADGFVRFLSNYLSLCSIESVASQEDYDYDIVFFPQMKFKRHSRGINGYFRGDLVVKSTGGDTEFKLQLPQGIATGDSFQQAEQRALDNLISRMDPALSDITGFFCSYKKTGKERVDLLLQN